MKWFLLLNAHHHQRHRSDSPCPCVSVNRISVHVRGGEAQGPAAGLSGMNLGLIGELGSAFFESHCELNNKTSSPFSSNRTMFETEEVRQHSGGKQHSSYPPVVFLTFLK